MADTIPLGKEDNKVITNDGLEQPDLPGSDISRVLPRQLSTGSTRGTQTVGYGDTKIDGSNNRITVGDSISLDGNTGTITIDVDEGEDIRLTLGNVSESNTITGLSLQKNNQDLVILGSDSSDSGTTGLTIFDGTGTRRLLGGEYPDGNIKIALSQEGYDVATATNDQLIWSSEFNTFKIVLTGTINSSPPASWTNGDVIRVTVAHNLGYTPAYLAYVDTPSVGGATVSPGLSNLPSAIYYTAITGGTLTSLASADNTNIYFDLINLTGLTVAGLDIYTWAFKYYLLQETSRN